MSRDPHPAKDRHLAMAIGLGGSWMTGSCRCRQPGALRESPIREVRHDGVTCQQGLFALGLAVLNSRTRDTERIYGVLILYLSTHSTRHRSS